MTAADAHELAKRDRRIAQLEREVERLGNVIAAQADRIVPRHEHRVTAGGVRSTVPSANALLTIIAGRDTDSLIEVRCRSPKSGRIVARDWFSVDDQARAQRFIADKSARLDVYVGVAPRTERAGGKAAIRHSWLLYVDADSAEAAEHVRRFEPRPNLIVRSGTGDNCHAYWSLTAPIPPAWFERANRRLAYLLGTDMVVTDAARILRPPGSLNHKHEPPVTVTLTHKATDVTTVAHIVGHLPDPPNHRPARRPRPRVDTADPLEGISADTYYTALTGRPVTYGNVQCPFHGNGQERNPSLRLYETTWFCFGCGKGGSVFEFGAALWGLGTRGGEFVELRDRLQCELGVTT